MVGERAMTARTFAEPPFVTRVRLRARRKVSYMRSVWSQDGSPDRALGLAIPDEEVDRILSDRGDSIRREREFYESDPRAPALAESIADADRRTASDALLERLSRGFGLSVAELDLLTLTVALEADPWFRRVCGYLHDDATISAATPWLARELF